MDGIQGAFYGGLIAICVVIALGVTAQIKYTDEPFLHLSTSECDCIVNVTESSEGINEFPHVTDTESDGGLWAMLYKVSYMYYSMIGAGLTVFFGLLVSMISDMFTRNQILKITSLHDVRESGVYAKRHFSVASFTLATGRKLSTFISSVAHDVSQSTLKVENKLKEVISHTNLHHLHHLPHLHAESEDRICILNEEEVDCGSPTDKETEPRKMFFIGHHEDEECEESLIEDTRHRHPFR